MPNVGRPSRDCHLCRQRRVKCDLGRPGCQRCVKYGKECPGYRDQQELVFRTVNPNPTTAKQKKQQSQQQQRKTHTAADNDIRSQNIRACSTESSSSSGSSDTGLSDDQFTEWTVQNSDTASSGWTDIDEDSLAWAIAPSLVQHWTAQSVPIVLTVYNSIEFLKDVLRENSFDGPLVWATHLFSRTYVTNIRQPTASSNGSTLENSQEIGTYMGKTLSAVSTALKHREGAFRDDIIGAVWMLCNYEIIVGSIGRMSEESPWHAHAAGLWSILKTRGKEALHTERGRNIFWPTYSLVQLDAIIGNHPCPPEAAEWIEVLRPYSSGFVGFHIAIFLTRVSQYQSTAIEIVLKRDIAAATAEYSALFSELTEAENDLGTFVTSMDRHAHSSDDYMMVMHLASLIKAYNILFLLTNLSTHDPESQIPLEVLYKRREYCLSRVRDSAWKILAATPELIAVLVRDKYSVFDALFNGLKLVWPLTAVRLMPTTLPSQKARAAKSLLLIGRQLGVRQATRTYSNVEEIPIEARVPKPLPDQAQDGSQNKTDLCIGYLDVELREPRPEELIRDFAPQGLSTQEKADIFMI